MGRKRTNYTGQKFGKLTILSFDKTLKKEAWWLCQCECGNQKSIRIRSIKIGSTKSCGLCPKPKGNQHSEWKGCGELSKDLFNSYRHSAIDRNLEFQITIEYVWDLFIKQNRRCAFTNWELYFPPSYKEKKNKTASLDRIDNTKGYVEGNLQWVHQELNYLKCNLDNDYFIKICKAVASNN